LTSPGFAPRRRAPSLDDPPTTPHAYDDEFDGLTLDPKWTRSSGGTFDDITPIDPYAAFATGHRTSLNGYRPSWWMVQGSSTGGTVLLYQSVVLPTDCFIWARCSFNCRYSAVTNNDTDVELGLWEDVAGLPSANNRVYMHLNETDTNTIQAQGGRVTAGVDASTLTRNLGPQSVGVDSLCQTACYVGIQKLGTTYHTMLGQPNGNWTILASQVHAGTLPYLMINLTTVGSAAPGCMITGCDFIRFLVGRYLP
jgi:hypothetical protein